jgi:hypothetical protein
MQGGEWYREAELVRWRGVRQLDGIRWQLRRNGRIERSYGSVVPGGNRPHPDGRHGFGVEHLPHTHHRTRHSMTPIQRSSGRQARLVVCKRTSASSALSAERL